MIRLRGTAVRAVEGCFRLYGHLTYFQTLCISAVLVRCTLQSTALQYTIRFTALHTDTNPRTLIATPLHGFKLCIPKHVMLAMRNLTTSLSFIYTVCVASGAPRHLLCHLFSRLSAVCSCDNGGQRPGSGSESYC